MCIKQIIVKVGSRYMARPTIQEIHVTLEKHIAVSEERFKESILRIKRIEIYMVSAISAIVLLLISLIVE